MQPAAETSRLTTLFADDDPFYRELAKAALVEAGQNVTVAEDGTSAASFLAKGPYDLAVIDLDMPGKDGFEVIKATRAGGPNAEVPIIVLTGHDDADVIERAYQAGATSFLVKPVNWALFVQHVRFVLKAAHSEAELRETSRLAQYLSDLKSNILSTLVTEFHSPLRNAHAYATLLRHEADGPIASDMYRQAIEDLSKMIDQLSETHIRMLNFGRILGETVKIEEAIWSPEKLVGEVVDNLQVRALRRDIKIVTRLEIPPGSEVRGDRALVGLTIKSLISNAIRFTPRRSTITVTAKVDTRNGFTLTVDDDAPMLSPEQVAEVLALPASRPELSVEGDRNASLTIGRLLTEAHQGELTITPRSDTGNRSSMTLPPSRVVDGSHRLAGTHPAQPEPRTGGQPRPAPQSSPRHTALGLAPWRLLPQAG